MPAFEPREGVGGFDAVCLAGAAVEQKLEPTQLAKVNFTDRDKEATVQRLRPETDRLIAAVNENPRFEFRPTPPLVRPRYVAGWRLLGECLVWRTEAAMEGKNPAEAVAMFRAATKFGRLMMQGDVSSAHLGLHVIDGARAAIAPQLARLGAGNLNSLATLVEDEFGDGAQLESALRNEQAQVRSVLQFFQDQYVGQRWESLTANFGTVGRDAARILKDIPPDSPKRVELFQKLNERIDLETEWQRARAVVPTAKRPAYPKLGGGEFGRLWISTFGMAGRGLISAYDKSLARCRLLGLTARLQALRSQAQPLPRDLSALPKVLRTDPVSGQEFVYRTNGVEFECYSIGADARDDLGRVNEDGLTPDLRLER